MEPLRQTAQGVLTFDQPPPLKQILWYLCNDCFDSGLIWQGSDGPGSCLQCAERRDLPDASAKLIRAIYERVAANKLINKQQFDVARALVKSTVQIPVPLNILMRHFDTTDRTIKGYIESLRTDWLLPIGSSKFPPSGYYWINSAEEFKAWLEAYLSQPKEEFRTAYRMLKANFSELTGQVNFNFGEER